MRREGKGAETPGGRNVKMKAWAGFNERTPFAQTNSQTHIRQLEIVTLQTVNRVIALAT